MFGAVLILHLKIRYFKFKLINEREITGGGQEKRQVVKW